MKTKEELVHFINSSSILFWEDVQRHGMTQVHLDAINEIPDTPDEVDDCFGMFSPIVPRPHQGLRPTSEKRKMAVIGVRPAAKTPSRKSSEAKTKG